MKRILEAIKYIMILFALGLLIGFIMKIRYNGFGM